MSFPSTIILPLVILSNPPIKFNNVDFPDPLLPKTKTRPPSGNIKLTSSNALQVFLFLDLLSRLKYHLSYFSFHSDKMI